MSSNKKEPLGYNEAFETLRAMIGKAFIYRLQHMTITEVSEIDNYRFMVMSDVPPPIKLPLDKVESFIGECTPVPIERIIRDMNKEVVVHEAPKMEVQQPQNFELKSVNHDTLSALSQGLMAQFQKVQHKPSKENIDAAHSMIGISNTITNLAKLELAAITLSKRQGKK